MSVNHGYALRLFLNKTEKDQLIRLVRIISDDLGMEVNMSWLIRSLVKLTLQVPQHPNQSEKQIIIQMCKSIESSNDSL
mgnify:CR=1 FL=1